MSRHLAEGAAVRVVRDLHLATGPIRAGTLGAVHTIHDDGHATILVHRMRVPHGCACLAAIIPTSALRATREDHH